MRVFSRAELVKIHLKDAVTYFTKPLRLLSFSFGGDQGGSTTDNSIYNTFLNLGAQAGRKLAKMKPWSPRRQLFTKVLLMAGSLLTMTSLTPNANLANGTLAQEYTENYQIGGDILVADESGYMVKINPQTIATSRQGLTDYALHSVESGETLSAIAKLYGVKMETLLWENGLTNANNLRIGQKILVPPVDGVSYKVQAGDTLQKIADRYKISTEAIIAQNAISGDVLAKGQSIFLPGARPIVVPTAKPAVRGRNAIATRASSRSYADVTPSSANPTAGRVFIFPTQGEITQGYKAGHYALDIANSSRPAVWAAGAGTVVKASSGTWGGGYGNHVVIDHGNGLKTLYAHLDSLNVNVGDSVNQGDVVGIMGNTGRVYGRTGIHLHWEVIENGVKKYPGNFY